MVGCPSMIKLVSFDGCQIYAQSFALNLDKYPERSFCFAGCFETPLPTVLEHEMRGGRFYL